MLLIENNCHFFFFFTNEFLFDIFAANYILIKGVLENKFLTSFRKASQNFDDQKDVSRVK